jgi:carboxyvinyl-carboxyphosphonate phosphorylmutase
MNAHQRRQAVRAILADNVSVHPAPVYDALSARIAQDIGFELGVMGGSMASLAVLGDPDLVLLTLSELTEQVRRCSRASAIPLIVDADHGFGNALNVRRTVEELEAAGAAALTIEDTALPQPFGAERAQFISVTEGVGKMKAALEARSDPDLVVIARIGSAPTNGIQDAIARAQSYEAAGVDGLFFAGLKTRAEVEALAASTRIPLTLGIVEGELADRDFLARNRVRFSLQGSVPLLAAIKATHDAMLALRERRAPKNIAGQPGADFMKNVTRDADHKRRVADYLGRKA